jgi:rhodanese-related sulfurtransferase
VKSLLAALVLSTALPALAQAPAAPAPAATAAPTVKPGKVDGATAKALVAAGAKVVDVRTPDEFAYGHVPGALNIPFDEIGKRTAEIGPASTPVVLYCRSGHRSGIAVETLSKAGYGKLYDLQTVTAWPGPLAK